MIGEWGISGKQGAITDRHYFKAKVRAQCLLAGLSVGSAPVANLGGVDMDEYGTGADFNVGRSVEAGDRGGGTPVPSSCSRTSLLIFYYLSDVGGSSNSAFLFAGG